MKRTDWVVGQEGIRAAVDDPNICHYCKQPIGAAHLPECVVRERTVVMDVTIRMVRRVPESWDSALIEFHMNESSWCASNILDEIAAQDRRMDCLCGSCEGKFVREATEGDERKYGLFVKDCKS